MYTLNSEEDATAAVLALRDYYLQNFISGEIDLAFLVWIRSVLLTASKSTGMKADRTK